MNVNTWNDLPLVLTVAEVANLLRVKANTISRMCAGGHLPAIKIGGSGRAGEWRIERATILKLFKNPPT